MILEFYLIGDSQHTSAGIMPNQLTPEYKDLEDLIFRYDKPLPPADCCFLAKVDLTNNTIEEILNVLPAGQFMPLADLEKIKQKNLSKLKSGNEKPPLKHKIPDDLFIPELTWRLLIDALDEKDYPFLIGPKGSGKTKTARALAHATGRAFFPINCGGIFKPKQTLIGTVHAKEGSTYLVDSEFKKHFTATVPTLIFLDEASRIPQGAANYMMTGLDGDEPYLYIEEEGRRIFPGKDVVFIAAGNFGMEYTDTRNLDDAWLDRFTKFMIDYLKPDEEIALLLARVPNVMKKNIADLVRLANSCRAQKEKLGVGVSTRQLLIMARFLSKGYSMQEVLENVFYNLFYNGSMDERESVKQMAVGLIP